MDHGSVLTRPAPGPDRTVAYGPDPDQVLDLWDGDAGRPLVVIVHGGFWRPSFDRTHTRPMAAALHAAGRPVGSLEYRRVPGAPERSVADVTDGLRAAAVETGDAGVVAVGHSAGGHLVLLAAATAGIAAGTVALAPVADLDLAERLDLGGGAVRDFLGGPVSEHRDLDPAPMAPAGPVVIVHGDRDDRVPLQVSESYLRRRPEPRLVAVPGADHFAVIDPLSRAWPAVVAAVEEVRAARSS